MNQHRTQQYKYQVGGSLPTNAPTYVNREADEQLFQALKQGDFCYVLNSRQMGKSSLRVQTMERLQAEGCVCVAIDITNIGTAETSVEEWYAGIIDTIISGLGLYDNFDLNDWWEAQGLLSPVNKLSKFFNTVLLPSVSQKIVIFIDEIDSVLSLNFQVDDFFALIRECYNTRASQPEYERLTFALLGVANPSDLIQDKRRTPFNIGRAIELTGFQLNEAEPLAQGLAEKTSNPMEVMGEVLDWTGGQPFLTQKLCKLVLNHETIPEDGVKRWLEELVQSQIIHNWEAQDEPEHLKTIRDRLLRGGGGQLTGRLLAIYKEIIEGGNHSPVRTADVEEQVYLRLSGLVVERQGTLRVYNRIYESIFDLNWVNQELKDVRPDFYAEPFEAWLESNGEDSSHLLKGENLRNALAWSQDKSLSNEDYRFISDSQKFQFAQTRKSTKRQTLGGTIALAASLAGVLFAMGLANQAVNENRTAQANAQEAQEAQKKALDDAEKAQDAEKKALEAQKKAQEAANAQREQAEVARLRTEAAQQQADDAQRKAEAEQLKAEAAQRKAEAEQRKAEAGQRQTEDAQQKANAAQQKANAAQQKANAAQQKADEASGLAERERLRAEKERQNALKEQLKVAKAEEQVESAIQQANAAEERLEGTKIEQAARNTLEMFVHAQTPQVAAMAMKALNEYKKQNGSYENIPPTLMLALNTVLDIPERTTLKLGEDKESYKYINSSEDGRFVVTVSEGTKFELWDTTKDMQPFTLHGDPSAIDAFVSSRLGNTESQKAPTRNISLDRAIFSQDGKYLITIRSNSSEATLWDISNPQKPQVIKKDFHTGGSGSFYAIYYVSISQDGTRVATTGRSGSGNSDNTRSITKVWDIKDVSNIQEIRTIKHDKGKWAYHVALNHDGTKVATAVSLDVLVWNTKNKEDKPISTLTGHRNTVLEIAFGQNKETEKVVTASSDNTARVWEIVDKERKNTQKQIAALRHQSPVSKATFSQDGKRVVTASTDNTAKVWDTNGNLLKTLAGHQDEVRHASFKPNSSTEVITASFDNTIKSWNIEDKLVKTLAGHRSIVNHGTFNRDGSIVTASDDGTARLWNAQGDPIGNPLKHERRVNHAAFNHDGTMVVTASDDNTAQIWNAQGKPIRKLEHNKKVNHATFNHNGTMVVSASDDRTAQIWNAQGKPIGKLEHNGSVSLATFSPVDNDNRIVTISGDIAQIWNANNPNKKPIILKGHTKQVLHADFSPNGQYIVTTSSDNTARIWGSGGKSIVLPLGKSKSQDEGHQSRVVHAAFSPDSKFVVTASSDNTARVWETSSGKLEKILRRQSFVLDAAFDPKDGSKILTTSTDKNARLWDFKDEQRQKSENKDEQLQGELFQTFKRHRDQVTSGSFSPDGKKILTSSYDGTVKLWTLETVEELRERGCNLLQDYFQNHPRGQEERKETGCSQQ